MGVIFVLDRALLALKSDKVADRVAEAVATWPRVSLIALNGIPFQGEEGAETYFGAPVDLDVICQHVGYGVGLGGLLTFMNRSRMSLDEMEALCLRRDHDWAMHSISVTILFVGVPMEVELALARDRRFHLSWVERDEDYSKPRVFSASAPLKTWRKVVGLALPMTNFSDAVNAAILDVYDYVLKPIAPAYFDQDTPLRRRNAW